MKKSIGILLLLGMTVLGITGCKRDDSGRYALVVNQATAETKACSDAIWDDMKEYGDGADVGSQRYNPKGTKRQDFADAIDDAVSAGAKVVVCIGEEAEVAVNEAQTDYQNVRFILVNGEPHKRYSERTNLKDNTVCLYFNETQQGYLAGYMAVMSGYRNLGCMGGAETETKLKIAAGFVQGVEAAGQELSLAEGDIHIYYTFTGVDKVSPAYMGEALDWYQNGCELIFVQDEEILQSILPAAKSQSAIVMTSAESMIGQADEILTASVIDYGGAVVQQLKLFDEDGFVGNQIINCGVKESGVALITENVDLSDNTMAQYRGICQKLSEGTLNIEETMVVPSTKIAIVDKE